MNSDVSDLFGARANAYASFRPHYPQQLFTWLAAQCPGSNRALDIACGNGQASGPLLEHFQQVLAGDASLEQLQAGEIQPGLQRFVAEAHAQPLSSHSIDLIVVAQALHWFATPAFFSEVKRLLTPNGLFCAWCYSLMRIDPELDALIDQFYWHTLRGYWPEGRASVDAGYRDIACPFAAINPPAFAMQACWSLDQLMGYLHTWSAVQRFEQQRGADPLSHLQPKLREAWGDGNRSRFIRWPLHFIAGRPN